jgi:soluble lytic murein transglycosylase
LKTLLRADRTAPILCGLLLALLLVRCSRDNSPATATPAAPVAAVATFTPTPQAAQGQAAEPAVGVANLITSTASTAPMTATVAVPSPSPTATLAPTPTPPAGERLAHGQRLLRYGDYAAARTEFASILNAPTVETRTRLQARYDLARSYLAENSYGEALAVLDQLDQDLAAADADPNEFARKEHFLRAEALLGQGQYSQAVAAYWQFLETYPWMAEIVQARIATAYRALGDHASAATALRRAADAATDTVAQARLLEDLAETYSSAGSYTEAVAVYDEILAIAQNAGYRAQLQYLAGQALASAGDLPGASERWRAATTESPESPAAYTALIEIVNRNLDFDLYQRGYIDLMAGAYLPAINAYQAYLDSVDVTDTRYGQALHGLGQSYLNAENYSAALPIFERVLTEFPTCSCFGQAWLDKALTQAWLGDSVGAKRTYRTFAREHAADPLAVEALWRSGILALREGNQVEAATDFLTLADAFPGSERAPAALYTVGLGAIQAGLHAQAVDIFTRLQRDYPKYKWDAVAYWLGRALAARGETAQARAQWQALVDTAPDIYYGILAAYSLRQQSVSNGAMLTAMPTIAGPATRLEGDDGSQAFAERWLNDWLKLPDANLSALPPTVAEDQDLRMARMLLELDQRADALNLLDRVFARNRDTPQALYALSLEFERLGTYRLSIVAMARLLEFSPAKLVEDAPIFLQQRSYPRHFRELLEPAATANGINPLLYYSLIRQESLFEEGARSSAAAQGLAQIIPETGQWVAEQLGHPEYTNEIIYRPYINLAFGAYYLDWVRDYTEGNLVSGLVGYNAGPGNAVRWRELSGADDALFVELMDYSEPRLYVQLVTANLYHYTRLYG